MKKSTLIIIGIIFTAGLHAQTVKSKTPLVDPVTNCALRYYYYPNLEAYYDTKKNVYIFNQKGQWITAQEIPSGYRGYSLYNKVSVFITDYDDDDPVQFNKIHKKRFPYNSQGKFKNLTASVD